tara:strand:+ start:872 stop:1177 length:306 start_codon:yes stop_codon:yes gene_type:complete
MSLTHVDHIALESNSISDSVEWYFKNFNCNIKYQDSTWALLKFDNIQIALVTPGEHPPHFAVIDKEIAKLDNVKIHRDGIKYFYYKDPDQNVIEKIDRVTS